jgi:SPP1 family predicted phage head-tail adaptor
MRAGDLDRRVTFRRASVTRGAFNEATSAWSDLVTVWAAKAEISDGERVRAAQTGARVTARFTVRWSPDTAGVTAKDQLVCEGRTFDIVGVKEIGRRVGLEFTCAAQADG